jgi:hypothetical protein
MPHAFEKTFSDVTKARHSYRLRPGLARSGSGPAAVFRRPRRCSKGLAKPAVFGLERDGSSLNRHLALSFCLSMIFPENR